jgi:hypothetical protein
MVEKAKEGTLKAVPSNGEVKSKKRGRWDQTVESDATAPKKKVAAAASADPSWEKDEVTSIYFSSFDCVFLVESVRMLVFTFCLYH